jgi:hypothetical protein
MKVLESRGAKTVRLEIPHMDAVNIAAASRRASCWSVLMDQPHATRGLAVLLSMPAARLTPPCGA